MEFYQELLLTALVSLLLAFLFGKIAAPAVAASDAASVPAAAGLKRSRTIEKRVRFREPAVEEREELPKDHGSDAVQSQVGEGDEFGNENMLREELPKDHGSDAVQSEVVVGDEFGKENMLEFGKENMLFIASTEVSSLMNDVNLSDIDIVSSELDIEAENTYVYEVNESGLEGESVIALQEVEVGEADVEPAMKMGVVESVEFDIEVESRVGDGSHGLEGDSMIKTPEMVVIGTADAVSTETDSKVESRVGDGSHGLEGESVMKTPELVVIGKVDVVSAEPDSKEESRVGDGSHGLEGESVMKTPELVVIGKVDAMSDEPDIKVESRDWDLNLVNEAGLEGKMVLESRELPKCSVAEVETGDGDASQGNESVVTELLGVLESSMVASEQNNELEGASQVNAAGLEGELVIELETTEFDAESTRDAVKEEIVELPKSSNVVCELDITKKSSDSDVSQMEEAGLGVEIEKVEMDSTAGVAEREDTDIIRSPESGGVENVESLLHGEDEWEGIQRSDVEKLFGVAASYTSGASGVEAASKLSNDVQMELYGLHKVATEGPCYEPQPLALMVAARAKWHAWQRLGSMNPEVAMEQYISLLTRNIPEWMGAKSGGHIKEEVDGTRIPDSGPSLYSEPSSIIERKSEDLIGVDSSSAIPALSGQDSP